MQKLLLGFVFIAALTLVNTIHAQIAPTIEWQKSLGGNKDDVANSIQQTADSGFIAAGTSYSNGGDVSGHHGTLTYSDVWIVKLDSTGNLLWQKSFGGSSDEEGYSVQQTHDGGYIVIGGTNSNDGDVSGNHGGGDFWVLKLDSIGNLLWQKCLGGSGGDWGRSIQEISTGGFIVAGSSASNDSDVTINHGGLDYWIVKLDTDANIVWEKSFGGNYWDIPLSIQNTFDGGFIVAGASESNDGDVSGNHGDIDFWIVKLNGAGDLVWQKSLGGSYSERANCIQQTHEGGFIVAGYSRANYFNDGDVTGNHGEEDYWIVKLDTIGNLVWEKSLGGSGTDIAYSIAQVADGFIIAGWSASNNNDVQGNNGIGDIWILELDNSGNLIWQKCYGGSYYEEGRFIQQTIDDGFIVAGLSASNDVDVSGHHGDVYHNDYWIIKLSPDIPTSLSPFSHDFNSISPNPVVTQLTINLSLPHNDVRLRVYDLQGRIIALPTTCTNTQAQLNTTSLPNGFYTLQIINNKTGESEVGKFVKQE